MTTPKRRNRFMKTPCTKCEGMGRAGARGMCQNCYRRVLGRGDKAGARKKAKRPEVMCVRCGRKTTAVAAVCRGCAGITFDTAPEHALTDGQWVLRGLIKVWVPDEIGGAA